MHALEVIVVSLYSTCTLSYKLVVSDLKKRLHTHGNRTATATAIATAGVHAETMPHLLTVGKVA